MTPEIRYSAGTRYEAPRVFPEYSPDHEFLLLNWEDWRFWRDNGYLVIRDLILKEQCEELIKVRLSGGSSGQPRFLVQY